jgi:hypothetical protein
VKSFATVQRPSRRLARLTLISAISAMVLLIPSAAFAQKDSHVTFAVNERNGPSVSAPILGVVLSGAPIVIYCQTRATDATPTTVSGHGTSWIWDFVAANVNGRFTRGYITDLAPDNTPYQVFDPTLPNCENLGGLDLGGWCVAMAGNTHVVLNNRYDAYGWACQSNTSPLQIPLTDVDMTHACQWQYGRSGDSGALTFSAYYTNRWDAYSWHCRLRGYSQ